MMNHLFRQADDKKLDLMLKTFKILSFQEMIDLFFHYKFKTIIKFFFAYNWRLLRSLLRLKR